MLSCTVKKWVSSVITKLKIVTLADDYAGGGRCLAQHGISFYIEIEDQLGHEKRILFDTGIYHDPIVFNANRLEVPLEKTEVVVLSHSHYDHTGGLLGILEHINKSEIPIIAHPDVFKKTYYKGREKNIGMENEHTKEEAEKLGGIWHLSKEPIPIADHATFLGQVPRVTAFEQEPTIQLETERNGQKVDDLIEDDSAIYIETPKGLVIISGCSHSGIVNIVKHAMNVSGGIKPYAVIGGFHLLSASDERIFQTTEALMELGVERLVTGHCTGNVAEYLFQQVFTTKYQKLFAGKTIQYKF